jgi:AraC-like DNA-binding protein
VRSLRVAPSADLAPFVRHFEVVEADDAVTRTLLPEPSIILGFRYAGASRLDGASSDLPRRAITGLRTAPRVMHTDPGSGIVLAKFHDGGAAAFVGGSLRRFFGKVTAFDGEALGAGDVALADKAVDRAAESIERSRDARERVGHLEAFLRAHRRNDFVLDERVAEAITRIRESAGAVRIADLARELDTSQDALEKVFRRSVGASPKQVATIVRFRDVLEQRGRSANLADLAYGTGHADQSHFIRRFRQMTGAPPGRLFGVGQPGESGPDPDKYCDPALGFAVTAIQRALEPSPALASRATDARHAAERSITGRAPRRR